MNTQLHVRDLILKERQRQKDKWGKQMLTPADWLIILNEEMGEWAKAAFEHEEGDCYDEQITEAVQIAAIGVQIAEWVSEQCGWPNNSEQALENALGYLRFGNPWPMRVKYIKMMAVVGRMAQAICDAGSASQITQTLLHQWSDDIRQLICLGYLLTSDLLILNGEKEKLETHDIADNSTEQ